VLETMSAEIELKLTLSPADARALAREPLLADVTAKGPHTQRYYGVYYDTPERALASQGVALRVRKQGRRWVQTVKGEGRVEGGLHDRPEYESPALEGQLNLLALQATPVAELFADPDIATRLAPVFVTDVRRTLRLIKTDRAEIEVALDRGELKAGERSEPVCELELELKSGAVDAVYELALALQDKVRLRIENRSKAERGHRLAGVGPAGPVRAQPPAIDAAQPVSQAFQTVAFACLAHAQANESGIVAADPDPEYVHQMRVGLRRLRSVFSVFGSVLPRPACQPAIDEIRWIAGSLGPARDWDVLATETLPPILDAFPDHAGLAQLAEAVATLRAEGNRVAQAAVASERYERLLLRVAAWFACERWRAVMPQDALPILAEPLQTFAERVLKRRHRRVKRRGRDHASFSPEERHQLRIAVKKLRYASEFFGPIFESDAVRSYARGLAALQDVLGVLNDAAVTGRLLQELAARYPDPSYGESIGIVSGWTRQFMVERLGHLAEVWERFEEAKPFWR
jgi:inorganic triphosphatase YgiF